MNQITVPLHTEAFFFLKVVPPLTDDVDIEKMFAGLDALAVLRDSDGNEILRVPFDSSIMSGKYDSEDIRIASFRRFRRGDSTATVQVDKGVPTLAGRKQTLYVKYQLCGIESMLAFFLLAFAIGSGVVAVVTGLCVLPGLRRHGIRRAGPPDRPEGEA